MKDPFQEFAESVGITPLLALTVTLLVLLMLAVYSLVNQKPDQPEEE